MPDLFSVPRRFDLFTILVAITGYALLFTFFRIIRLLYNDPYADGSYAFAVAGGLFAAVALGQALLQSMSPRKASFIAAVAYWMIFLIEYCITHPFSPNAPASVSITEGILTVVFAGPAYGLVTGYPAGVLAAGVFLVSHHLRENWSFLRTRKQIDDRQSPWDEGRPSQPILTQDNHSATNGAPATVDLSPLKLTSEEFLRPAIFDAEGNLVYIQPSPPI